MAGSTSDSTALGSSPERATSKRGIMDTKAKAMRHLFWVLPLVLALSLCFGWIDHRAMEIDVSPEGGPDPFFGLFPFVLVEVGLLIFSCLAIPITIFLTFFRRLRWPALFVLFVVLTYFFGGLMTRHAVFGSPRQEAFHALGERLTPLVEAIEAYHVDHHKYPGTLDDLVPLYLPELPTTGMGNYKDYRYIIGPPSPFYAGNPWVIEVPAGYGMGFDMFYYYPLQNYPRDQPFERLGRWAYYHE